MYYIYITFEQKFRVKRIRIYFAHEKVSTHFFTHSGKIRAKRIQVYLISTLKVTRTITGWQLFTAFLDHAFLFPSLSPS